MGSASSKALEAAGADSDAELIAAARAVLALTGGASSGGAKYVVQAQGNQGIQIGDHNRQDDAFRGAVAACPLRPVPVTRTG